MMLGDLGARVIEVETPAGGDDTRGWGPPFVGPPDAPISTYYLSTTGTRSPSPSTSSPTTAGPRSSGVVRHADVILENFRPAVLDRLGFGIAACTRNPGLVILSITGFEHDGPEGTRAGYDQIAQGEAGLMSITGEPGQPTRVGVPSRPARRDVRRVRRARGAARARTCRRRARRPDQPARRRRRRARVPGHPVDGAGEAPAAQGNHHPSIAPYRLFHAADGDLQRASAANSGGRSSPRWSTSIPTTHGSARTPSA